MPFSSCALRPLLVGFCDRSCCLLGPALLRWFGFPPASVAAAPDPATSWAPHRLFNIGNSQPVELLCFIAALEQAVGREAIQIFLPLQPGDAEATAADTALLEAWVGFRPFTPLEQGVERFAAWYCRHHG